MPEATDEDVGKQTPSLAAGKAQRKSDAQEKSGAPQSAAEQGGVTEVIEFPGKK